jgi:hypothetical protein
LVPVLPEWDTQKGRTGPLSSAGSNEDGAALSGLETTASIIGGPGESSTVSTPV